MTKTGHVKSQLKQKKTCLKKYCNILSSPFRTSQKIVSNLNFSDINSNCWKGLLRCAQKALCLLATLRETATQQGLAAWHSFGWEEPSCMEVDFPWYICIFIYNYIYIHMILMCTKSWCKFCIEATKETLCLDTLCKQWWLKLTLHPFNTSHGFSPPPWRACEQRWKPRLYSPFLLLTCRKKNGHPGPSNSKPHTPEDLRPTPVFFK